jgi:hypothetical protein
MQSNENNEFSGAHCVAGWVRVTNEPPIVSGGYNSRTCRVGRVVFRYSYPPDTIPPNRVRRTQRCPNYEISYILILHLEKLKKIALLKKISPAVGDLAGQRLAHLLRACELAVN